MIHHAGRLTEASITVDPPEVGISYLKDGSGNLTNTPRWIRPAKCAAMARATVACRTSSPTSMFRSLAIGFAVALSHLNDDVE
jgi:hypothetical protein